MADQTHPCWGQPLNQYVSSYGLDAAKRRAALTPELRIEAGEAIGKICRIRGETHAVNRNNEADEVTLSAQTHFTTLYLRP
jgi:hypothetical protein